MRKISIKFAVLMVLILGITVSGAFADDHGGGGNGGHGGHDDNEVNFTGTITSLPGSADFTGDWVVDGRTVHVTAATRVEREHGQPAVGATVKVEGTQRADGSVDASEVNVKNGAATPPAGQGDVKFSGTIESLPSAAGFIGDWQVGGRTIHVTAATKIETQDGPVAVGAFVEIEGTMRADGSMDATKIEIKSNVAGGDGRDELEGTITSLPSTSGFIGDWVVNGRTVNVTAATIIDQEHGPVVVGARVEVKGTLQPDGSINATRIEVRPSTSSADVAVSQKGTIESLPSSLIGDWQISGQTVHVTSSTKLKGGYYGSGFSAGSVVKIVGIQHADGSIDASKIQVKK